ncbi:V-set domain containing T-cell activation inhibitor 1-like [Echeneis naucrates]|uniref:V-set domain containing T-cell activation inhibitor 1-like n=1 Tax=Echeneis naucrates TaxID=173247 RepID=UPI001113707D|nr:V-set domain containing T-cell activation inhibitor 1-like [Echeneis naucrates]
MELLPVCLWVLIWSGSTSAAEAGPEITVIEGHDVTLPCSISEDITAERFDWRADGQKEVYVYEGGLSSSKDLSGQHEQFKGRVSHFPGGLKDGNASIKISNMKVSDSGKYSCEFRRTNQKQHVKLLVGAAPEPSVTILNQTKDLALLQCKVYGAFPEPEVQWKDSAGNIIPAEKPDVTKTEGKYNIILQTTVTKTDYYRCVSTQETIRHQIDAKIFVLISGTAQKPNIVTIDQTDNWAQLQCEVLGASPKPEVQWKDREGNILPAEEPKISERGGSYDITLQIKVTKTGYYRCVSTQETIRHQTEAETYIYLHGSLTGWIVAAVFGSLFFGVVVVAVLRLRGYICTKGPSDSQKEVL